MENFKSKLSKITVFIVFVVLFNLLLNDKALSQTLKAITEDGREVILYPDGTWEMYKKDGQLSYLYKKPLSSQKFVTDKHGIYNIWFNENKWELQKEHFNPDTSFEFTHKDGDVYAMIISERIVIPIETLKNIALMNAKNVAPDSKITFTEKRIVNGTEILCLQIEGTVQGMPFVYLGYYYGGDKGSIQVVTYTIQNLFKKYKNDMTDLLNGLVIY
jgi:hypothetical protein